ncbi:UDP-N-acetylmuramoyl-L-alanyl-D-glutamate--2,6-diaminopimelate ligase [Caldinitratiruptor microaerophilus]|uniref:UDP-N-acetylmuramoyl-L-alanyl-D-glutamate--2,6-diaminopimelate ligase n=1 Tax=Caldinitratiruptor microaerophilus TaxID=671077 RepID=A0AA35CNS4_9FIRM|nr:UDP-N-acetylmuramoyl-L-alanyl-D-glutamate--2,6-diaminopimelate ligase [Caldinitratiruptor microaerophilus]
MTADSRQVTPGAAFVAIRGLRADGHDFVGEAAARGAALVVVERAVPAPAGVAVLEVPSSRRALAAIAARFHGHPSRRLRVIGVTGTNGKTTTTHLIRAILKAAGHPTGLIGTVRNWVVDEALPVVHTTPEAPELQALLARMVDAGAHHAVMEVSSHALALHRTDELEFDIGVFTNLTQDHLDFHGDMDAYREAKGILFRRLGEGVKPGPKAAVLGADDPASAYYRSLCRVPVLTYGVRERADVRAEDIRIEPEGAAYTLVTPGGSARLHLQFTGLFNVYNSLAAAATAVVEGIPLDVIQGALEATGGVDGRMEAVRAGQPFGVFVDYAHTPDGLENVLRAVRAFARGRVIVVFGAGGDRDPTKRAPMGRIAARLADYAVITSDNPRTEDPESIVRQVEQGFLEVAPAGDRHEVRVDRTEAIARAVEIARPGDVVVIAGKGHETYQIVGDRRIPFDDREVARRAIQARLAGRSA